MDLTMTLLWRIADGPVSYEHLLRWVRIQWPRILPEAVARSVSELRTLGLVECIGQEWRVNTTERQSQRPR
jgi:Fe2+ or Zn2+ uptake regulation protein